MAKTKKRGGISLATIDVDMTPEVFTWDEDEDVKITGVPLTPSMREKTEREVSPTVSTRGEMRLADTMATVAKNLHRCGRSWEGISVTQNGAPAQFTADNCETVARRHFTLAVAATRFFSELYDERVQAQEAREGN